MLRVWVIRYHMNENNKCELAAYVKVAHVAEGPGPERRRMQASAGVRACGATACACAWFREKYYGSAALIKLGLGPPGRVMHL